MVEFELVREQDVSEIGSRALLYRHARLGTELLSLINQDENKVFGITFRTPPSDSTGVAHILEHSVLCGSKRFPVKRPFVELRKGSLNTFLNAFTSPDKTSYPVASQNLQDFYNLIDVYVDAVLHPLIPQHIFDQEGWSYQYDPEREQLIYQGVVYNEMKGVHSDPDHLLALWSRRSLFPDNIYQHDSGGDPREIPKLTYRQFKAFHEKYYHPANARIYFYGDDPPEKRLALMSDYLSDFEPARSESEISLQKLIRKPTKLKKYFASGEIKGAKGLSRLTVNWLLAPEPDEALRLAFQVLDHILMGTPGSPLRKRLMDSGLGEDLTGYGSAAYLRQMFFSVGLKGMQEENAEKVTDLIIHTLDELARDGFDQDTIEASINTIEFRLREQNTGSYPRGLLLMLRSLNAWLHDGDPIAPLAFEQPLAAIKERSRKGDTYFGALIEKYLINNKHRTIVLLSPDRQLSGRLEDEEKSRLATIREGMTPAEIDRLISYNQWLKEEQERPDPPELLSRIPLLRREDLDQFNKLIPSERKQINGVPTLTHDLATNGIVYLDLSFNLRALRQEDLPLIRLFGRALYQMGTKTENYVDLTRRISKLTGGIRSSTFISSAAKGQDTAAWLVLRGKATEERSGDLLAILDDILRNTDFDQPARFRQMLEEEKSGLESSLLRGGHVVVSRRLRARLDEAAWISEQTAGVDYLFFLRKLLEDLDGNWEKVRGRLFDLKDRLISQQALVLNITADGKALSQIEGLLERFARSLPDIPFQKTIWVPDLPSKNEALIMPSQVNFVGKGASLYDFGYHHNGSVEVILQHIRSTWLWEKVRVQGGAYGAMINFNRHSGLLSFSSYRDPNVGRTIETYDSTANYLRVLELSERELTKSIIGTIGDLDAFLLPDAKGYRALGWHLIGETDEARQVVRDQILATTAADFRRFADLFDEVARHGITVVLGSREKILAEDAGPNRFAELTNLL